MYPVLQNLIFASCRLLWTKAALLFNCLQADLKAYNLLRNLHTIFCHYYMEHLAGRATDVVN